MREVPTEKAKAFANENRLSFIETSAKDNHNVQSAFEKLIAQIAEKQIMQIMKQSQPKYGNFLF